jgi:phthalate 4,5-dioxygenase oxygenase subunit
MRSGNKYDLLVHTGPGTAMGDLFRRYWTPVLLGSELPSDGCPPVRVKLLSESLIAFRDGSGQVGLIDEFCAHRRVSLWFGRVEEDGIRCPYHGWKFDVEGQCLEVPSEAPGSNFCDRVKLAGYPLVLLGGIYWTYMGPPEHRPPLPEFEFALVPDDQRFTSKRLQESNWLQGLEGGIDSSHVSWLHRSDIQRDPLFAGAKGNNYNLQDPRPVFQVIEQPAGLHIGARREADAENYYWRITPWCMPSFTMVPPRGDHPIHGHFWIPIDDQTCWVWSFDYHPARALSEAERAAMVAGKGIHTPYKPGTFIPSANSQNDYLMNREAQRDGGSISGIEGIGMQDAALQESMGPIVDRTREILTGTDLGIVLARSQLLRAAQALAERKEAPPGIDPQTHRIRSASIVLPKATTLDEAATYLTQADGVAHASI